jgi:hypothetical protein
LKETAARNATETAPAGQPKAETIKIDLAPRT